MKLSYCKQKYKYFINISCLCGGVMTRVSEMLMISLLPQVLEDRTNHHHPTPPPSI